MPHQAWVCVTMLPVGLVRIVLLCRELLVLRLCSCEQIQLLL
jgi:hypothetical protein